MRQLDFNLYSRQYQFVTSPERFTSFIGGIGSGKTTAGSIKALVESARLPGSLGLVTAPTYPMLKDATIRTLLDALGPSVVAYNKSESEITLTNGSQILLRSAEKPDRLRGPNCHWAWIDEAALCPPGTWDIVIGRLRADGKAGPCWLTSTPKGHNWVYQKRALMKMFKASTRENPFLHPDFIQSLIDSYSGDFAAQEIEAEFVRFEGQIYDEFDYSVHVRSTEDEKARGRRFIETWMAADEGYINPQCFLLFHLDDDDGVHVSREFYERKVRTPVAARVPKIWAKDIPEGEPSLEVVYVDPSAAALSAEITEDEVDDDGSMLFGIPSRSAKNPVLRGIQTIKSFLVTETKYGRRLTFDPSCVNLISEIEQYAWKDWKAGKREEPIKMNDHAMDTLRYGVYSHLGGLTGSLLADPTPQEDEDGN